MSFQWLGSSTIRHSTEEFERLLLSETGLCFSNWIEVYSLKKTRSSSFIQNPQRCWGGLLRRTVWPVGTPTNISAMSYSPRFRQKSEQLMQRESRTSGELLLPVSRRPSHREIDITEEQQGTLKNLKQDKSMVVHMADSSIAVVLLDGDPIPCHNRAHQDCTVSVQQGWPDQQHQPRTTREASQAGSMSEAVNNKVWHDKDNHLGFTTYWKYKANSVILLRSIESYPTTCLLF